VVAVWPRGVRLPYRGFLVIPRRGDVLLPPWRYVRGGSLRPMMQVLRGVCRRSEGLSFARTATLSAAPAGVPVVAPSRAERVAAGMLHRWRLRLSVSPVNVVVAPVVAVASIVAFAAVARLVLHPIGLTDAVGATVLLVAASLAELFPVPILGVKAGKTSLATIAIVTTAVLYGWATAALAGTLTMFVVEARRRKPPLQVAYNSALYTLAGGAAGALSGLLSAGYRTGLVGSTAFWIVNITLLAAVISRVEHASYYTILRDFIGSTFTPFVVMAATTAILIELWYSSPFFALLLLPPLIAIAGYQRSLYAAMERQRELDRLKEEFVAVVSHELRTPLASVYGGVETLARTDLSEEMRGRMFDLVRSQSGRLARLVDEVLWASKLDSPQAQMIESFDANMLVNDVVERAAVEAPVGISVTRGAERVPLVRGNRDHVERILQNLLENAVKYSPEGGTIRVSTDVVDDRAARFTVTDEGLGVPEGDRERIFEKFTRVDPQMRKGIGGTGLGLYICRQLIEQMSGRIWVESRERRGSAFMFELPCEGGSRE
jgi:signal transduction histidine kinase